MSQLTDKIAGIWDRVQGSLFPALDAAGVEMTEKLYQHAALLEVLRIEQFVVGAKAFDNATDTNAFRDRLRGDPSLRKVCGWRHRGDVPSESTFSRAFAVFTELALADTVHEVKARKFLGATPWR